MFTNSRPLRDPFAPVGAGPFLPPPKTMPWDIPGSELAAPARDAMSGSTPPAAMPPTMPWDIPGSELAAPARAAMSGSTPPAAMPPTSKTYNFDVRGQPVEGQPGVRSMGYPFTGEAGIPAPSMSVTVPPNWKPTPGAGEVVPRTTNDLYAGLGTPQFARGPTNGPVGTGVILPPPPRDYTGMGQDAPVGRAFLASPGNAERYGFNSELHLPPKNRGGMGDARAALAERVRQDAAKGRADADLDRDIRRGNEVPGAVMGPTGGVFWGGAKQDGRAQVNTMGKQEAASGAGGVVTIDMFGNTQALAAATPSGKNTLDDAKIHAEFAQAWQRAIGGNLDPYSAIKLNEALAAAGEDKAKRKAAWVMYAPRSNPEMADQIWRQYQQWQAEKAGQQSPAAPGAAASTEPKVIRWGKNAKQ